MALPNKLHKLDCLEACCAGCMPVIGCDAALCGAPALCMALYSAGGALALCMALYSAGGIPGAPVRDIGAPGSMLICPCVTGGKLGCATSKGAVVWLAVTTRGDACAPEINTRMVGARHVIMAGSSTKL